MSTWRGQTDAKKIAYDDDDDDWDTEADFVNDVSEKEQRWGSKTIEGSLNADKDVSVREVREAVVTMHEKKVKEEYQRGPMSSTGYGGKFGVQKDRMDKSAESWSHNEEVAKHSSVTDTSKGFGGKFGVQKDRQDKTSLGYDHQTELSKHNSQTDGAKGFGGKFGIHHGNQDKNAVGYDHRTELSKHNSQTDMSKGFGGKFGVDTSRQDKAAQGYSDGAPVTGANYKTEIDVKGDVKNFRSRFENFGANQEDESRKKLEAEREKRRKDDEKRKIEEKKREEERDRQFELERQEKADKQAELTRREEEIAEGRRRKEEESRVKERQVVEEQSAERRQQEEEQRRRDEDERKRQEEKRIREEETKQQAERQRREEEAKVEKEEAQKQAEAKRVEEERKAEAERKRQEEEKLAKQTAALSVSVSGGVSATAVFDYTAGDADEISFSQGDVISNVEQPDEGWWVGEIGGKKGMFPASYVTLNEDVPAEPVKPKRQSSSALPVDEGLCGVALYTYTAADTDELTFDEGEKITNVEKPDEGWWLGVCRGRKGIFPASYITLSESAAPNLGQCGQAIYSYTAADVDELTLVEGVKVTHIEMIDEGWWMGQSNGAKGIFPASYVQLDS